MDMYHIYIVRFSKEKRDLCIIILHHKLQFLKRICNSHTKPLVPGNMEDHVWTWSEIMLNWKNQSSPKTRMFTTFTNNMTGPMHSNNVACYLKWLDDGGCHVFLYLRPMIDMDWLVESKNHFLGQFIYITWPVNNAFNFDILRTNHRLSYIKSMGQMSSS